MAPEIGAISWPLCGARETSGALLPGCDIITDMLHNSGIKQNYSWRIRTGCLALLFVAAGACSPPADDPGPEPQVDAGQPGDELPPLPGEVPASEVERDLMPDVAPGALDALVAGNTAFAIEMYRGVQGQPGNYFMSPLSVSLALAMTYAGARGDTATQMAQAMHFDLPGEELHSAFNALDLALDSRGFPTDGSDGRLFKLNLANATFGQLGYPFLQEYVDLLAEHYESGMSLLDFAADPDAAVDAINGWIAAATNDRIVDILQYGDISPLAKLVLVNTIYFNANWAEPFAENGTEPGTFKGLAGDVTASMMSGGGFSGYYQGPDHEAFSVAYDGGELDMVIIVPDDGLFIDVENALDSQFLADTFSALEGTGAGPLVMPKFEFRQKIELRPLLESAGMTDAFDPELADFSGIDGTNELFFHRVIHEAFIAVDEEGTEAAGVTVVLPPPPSIPPPPRVIDRPFIFLIRDRATNAVLFLGRVVDPVTQ